MQRFVLSAIAAVALLGLSYGHALAQSAPNTCLCNCYFDRDCVPGYFCDFRATQQGGSCLTNNIGGGCAEDSKICDGICTQIPDPTPRCAECQDESCTASCSE